MNDTLAPIHALFDALFPSMATPQAPDWIDLERADDAKRAAHVAQVMPQFQRLYAATPERIAQGLSDVGLHSVKQHRALVSAIADRDEAEMGRQLLAITDARIAQLAEDAATDEAYALVPERAIP